MVVRPAVEIPAQMLFTEYRDEKGEAPIDLLLLLLTRFSEATQKQANVRSPCSIYMCISPLRHAAASPVLRGPGDGMCSRDKGTADICRGSKRA